VDTANFQSCIELCDADPQCTEAIFAISDGICTETTFSCDNPHPPADSDIAILVGHLGGTIIIPSCLYSPGYLGVVSTCSAQIVATTTFISTYTITSCASSLSCAALSSTAGSQSFLWLSSARSGQGLTSTLSSSSVSGVNSLMASATVLPDCPNEAPGRLFSDNLGQIYGIYCGQEWTGALLATQNQSSLAACINACDIFNIIYQNVASPCQAVSFINGAITGQCLILAGGGTLVPFIPQDEIASVSLAYRMSSEDNSLAPSAAAIGRLDSALLEPPGPPIYGNFLTHLPALTVYVPGSAISVADPTDPALIGPICPSANNTEFSTLDGNLWWIICGPLIFTKRTVTSNAFAQCIQLCDDNPSCSYASIDLGTGTCTQETYDCQYPNINEAGGVLINKANR
jgi:hypothetical protein